MLAADGMQAYIFSIKFGTTKAANIMDGTIFEELFNAWRLGVLITVVGELTSYPYPNYYRNYRIMSEDTLKVPLELIENNFKITQKTNRAIIECDNSTIISCRVDFNVDFNA
jgi:hypothetical protein